MKKLLSIILLITTLFALSCNHNKAGSSSTAPLGEIGKITVNPNGVTPLSAVYVTETVNTAPITVTVKGLDREPDIIHTYPAGYSTEFAIHGMFPETVNEVIVDDGGRIITENVNVGTLSYDGITIQKKYDVAVNNLPEEKYPNNPELYFVSYGKSGAYLGIVGISSKGYVRYINNNNTLFTKIYIYNSEISFFNGENIYNGLYDLLGNTLIKYPTKSHHDVIKINDSLLYLGFSVYGYEDKMILIDSFGNEKKVYSFGELIQNTLDLNTYPDDDTVFKQIVFGEDVNNIYNKNGWDTAVDWFHANSIVYDSDTDILYVSSRHRGVLAIDYSDWKLIWWMADDSLYVTDLLPYDIHFKNLKSLEAYRVKGDAINDGPKNQHALFLHKNGNLGMFDNQGDGYNNNPNGSRYVEYQITGSYGNWTAKKVYEYISTDKYYSKWASDIDFTGENYQNLLFFPANKYVILEIEKETQKELFKINLPFAAGANYRADKMPLYYDEGRVYSKDCNLKNPN